MYQTQHILFLWKKSVYLNMHKQGPLSCSAATCFWTVVKLPLQTINNTIHVKHHNKIIKLVYNFHYHIGIHPGTLRHTWLNFSLPLCISKHYNFCFECVKVNFTILTWPPIMYVLWVINIIACGYLYNLKHTGYISPPK